PSEGLPYTILVFSGLLPWNLFAASVSGAGTSMVVNRNLVTKIYFPRVIVPMAKVFESLLDFFISCVILIAMMLFYKIIPGRAIIIFPLLVLWAVVLSLGVGFWLSALNVKYRDVTYATPFLIQIWLYVSPIAYSLTLIPEKWRLLYFFNPMVGIIESFRWVLFGKGPDLFVLVPVSLIVTAVVFISGFVYFCATEKNFADII
ncbi:MAG: ABC transporter permease, partial [Candidatus Omnitrophica bacterium]|nr:ABC transporter permease [Candidatus Omnitrophota bacterium]